MKKFVLNADDLAKSEFHNNAVLEGFKKGFLKSTSIMVNMPSFEDAICRIIQPNPKLGVGIHLNLIEGKALNLNLKTLCDNNGNFKNGYLNILLKSKNKNFLKEVEIEFRSQIELAQKYIKLTHIDSHVHIHSIPAIFEITAKLANEYNIKQIRTQAEIPYFISNEKKYKKYLINLAKVMLLNYFTLKNKPIVKKYNLNTNDYIIGVGYTGMMSSTTVLEGLKKIKGDNTVEALIHPAIYYNETKDSHTKEFEITQDKILKDLIENLGYITTNYTKEQNNISLLNV